MRHDVTDIRYDVVGSMGRHRYTQPKPSGPEPALNITPLDPEQVQVGIDRVKARATVHPTWSVRSLARAAGYRGLPLEQVVAAYEAEDE